MHFKAENLTIPKHPRLLFLAQNLGVLWPSKTWEHFFGTTCTLSIIIIIINKAVSGYRAEQRIFDELQRQFSGQPCLLMNGFSEHDLIKVVKSKLQQEKKGIHLSDQVKNTFENNK